MGDELEEFFLNEKPARILVSLRQQTTDNYATSISRQVDSTYSHTVKVLHRMEDFNLIEYEQKGRKREITLTQKGERIAEILDGLLDEFA